MVQNISAEIVSIGTELLLGEITDTNSVHIARSLRDVGISVYRMTTLGDNEARITEAIQHALARADVVITTGGLGPTVDDVTRQAAAAATARELVFHQSLLDDIAARFAGFRTNMTANNRRQAWLPQDAILLENPVGTAPCFIVEHGGGAVISLPGVPREMRFVLAQGVLPWLQRRYRLGVIPRPHAARGRHWRKRAGRPDWPRPAGSAESHRRAGGAQRRRRHARHGAGRRRRGSRPTHRRRGGAAPRAGPGTGSSAATRTPSRPRSSSAWRRPGESWR